MKSGKLLLFLAAIISLSVADNEHQARIVGGSNAVTNVASYMVAFVWRNMQNNPSQGYFCSGSLIDEEYVLSAASCFDNPATNQVDVNANSVVAFVGFPDLNATGPSNRIIDVRSITIHNEWNPTTGPLSNVAIIRLDNNVPNGVNPLTLARPADDAYFTSSGNAVVAGWGVVTADSSTGSYSRYLQQVTIPLVTYTACQAQSPRFNLTDRYLCAGSASPSPMTACVGDEGAPLVVMYNSGGTTYPVQVGIMTTVSTVNEPRCNGRYGIYAKVPNSINFNYVSARAPLLFYPPTGVVSTTNSVTSGFSVSTGSPLLGTTGTNATAANSSTYLSLSALTLLASILFL